MPPSNPSTLLWIVQIGTLARAEPPTCDPALDLDGQVAPVDGEDAPPTLTELLTQYERTRDPALAARLPVHPGQQLVQLAVGPLTAAAYRWASEVTGVSRAQRAFLACCTCFKDGEGMEHHAAKFGASRELGRGIRMASEAWLDHVQDTLGASVVDEVAAVALERAKAGPRAVAPFSLPAGLSLPI